METTMQSNVYVAIHQTVKTYVTGMQQGDGAALAKAFHPDAVLFGNAKGVATRTSLAEFIRDCSTRALSEDAPLPAFTVESIQLAGDTAVVRCTNSFDGARYRDTLNLLRQASGWVIVAKIYDYID